MFLLLRGTTTGVLEFLTLSQDPPLACAMPVILRAAVWIAKDFVGLRDELEFLATMQRSRRRHIRMVSLRQHQICRPDDFGVGVGAVAKQRVVVRCHRTVPASSKREPLPHRLPCIERSCI